MSHHPDHDRDTEAIGEAIRTTARSVQAPPALRARIEDERRRAGARHRLPRVLRRPPALAAGLAVVAAAVVLAVTGLPGGTGAGPSVDAAAALALARPIAPPPAVDTADATDVQASVDGLAFPNYQWRWPRWETTGERRARIGGRDTTTVTYRGPTGDVGYTIVDGRPLTVPDGARHVSSRGIDLAVLHRGGATLVVWERGGHTCILAGRGTPLPMLVNFATWA